MASRTPASFVRFAPRATIRRLLVPACALRAFPEREHATGQRPVDLSVQLSAEPTKPGHKRSGDGHGLKSVLKSEEGGTRTTSWWVHALPDRAWFTAQTP